MRPGEQLAVPPRRLPAHVVGPDAPLSPEEIRQIMAMRSGDGGAADIVLGSLQILQTRYVVSDCPFDCDDEMPGVQPCNIVLLLWEEDTFNPDGVDILIDGEFALHVDGLTQDDPNTPEDENQLPGTNAAFVLVPEAGDRVFAIEELNGGTGDELMMPILDVQPFGDVANLQCSQFAVQPAGTCQMLLTFANAGPFPEYYFVGLGGSLAYFLDPPGLPFALRSAVLVPDELDAGTYDLAMVGFLPVQPGDDSTAYRGCIVQDTCELTCEPVECRPPVHPHILQTAYGGDDPAGNAVLAVWAPRVVPGVEPNTGEFVPYEEGVNIYDFALRLNTDPLPGAEEAVFISLPAGEHIFGVSGICLGGVESAIVEQPYRILPETPYTDPVEGSIQCTYDAESRNMTATWTNGNSSAFFFVFRTSGDGTPLGFALPGGTTAGTETSFIWADTDATDELSFQFFTYRDETGMHGEQAFGSDIIVCESDAVLFVRGKCAGTGTRPQISDAIFLLGFLFLGSEAPGCRVACDADADGNLGLTDAIRLLNFLFLGGPPPGGWAGTDPTCEVLGAGTPGFDLGCEAPRPECTTAGPVP